MAKLKIRTYPDPVLAQKAAPVTDFGSAEQKLFEDMIETMRDAPGVGLAAPQVGVSQRLIVVEYGSDEDENAPKKLFVLANPEIVQASEEKVQGVEACLSIPRMMGEVDRHIELVIKGHNRYGKPVKLKVKNWLARIFQHEIDHLEGVLFTDRATRIWRAKEGEVVPDEV